MLLEHLIDTSLYDSMRKYGINAFEFAVLEEVQEYLVLTSREQYYIDYNDASNRSKGYNICPLLVQAEVENIVKKPKEKCLWLKKVENKVRK